ncbi:hypothetical protein VTJ04DRAFT_7438 [Mycothermus thermophilus]|uniref:uncharacterized protein n=1 Tax=Humicola insolens TaxID=85995 RepID=UPI003743B05D
MANLGGFQISDCRDTVQDMWVLNDFTWYREGGVNTRKLGCFDGFRVQMLDRYLRRLPPPHTCSFVSQYLLQMNKKMPVMSTTLLSMAHAHRGIIKNLNERISSCSVRLLANSCFHANHEIPITCHCISRSYRSSPISSEMNPRLCCPCLISRFLPSFYLRSATAELDHPQY